MREDEGGATTCTGIFTRTFTIASDSRVGFLFVPRRER